MIDQVTIERWSGPHMLGTFLFTAAPDDLGAPYHHPVTGAPMRVGTFNVWRDDKDLHVKLDGLDLGADMRRRLELGDMREAFADDTDALAGYLELLYVQNEINRQIARQ